ncbi:MAG TPA: patatin-like phospholipase family protein [Nitrospirota bacterium]|nr:patatin-like phospholipase family protein [Nitrospirota bacterium]
MFSPPHIIRRLGLALSGGATRGLAHIGVLQAFEDSNVKPEYLSGTSIGAFAAALYAFGVPLREIRLIAQGMAPLKVSKLSLSKLALFSNEELGRLIQARIGKARIEESLIPLAIMTVDIGTGKKVVLRSGEVAPAVMASNALPGLYRPITIDGMLLVDGGIAEDVPVSPLRPMGADLIAAVNLSAERRYSRPNDIIDIILNAIDIAIDENTKQQVRQADVLIEPQLSHFARLDVSRIDDLIAEGYRASAACMDRIKELLSQPAGRIAEDVYDEVMV